MRWEAEFSAFCGDEHPRLVGALSLYCGKRDIAEELAQEALFVACRDWRKVRETQAPGAWVHRVAMNLANSYFRRRAAETRAKRRLSSQSQGATLVQEDHPEVMAIRLAVASLPRRQRTALILRYYIDLSVRDVAILMDCPEGTVKSLTSKAVDSLRRTPSIRELQEVNDA